ncbi:MAG: hypothetical protein IJX47_04285, partial [Clostridia bacterium]|nr:hypothetical protein [Clostridia bacterium]
MKTKLLSLLLTLSLLIPVLSPLTAIAEEGTPTVEANVSETVGETASTVSEIELAQPIRSETLTTDNLPFAMTEADAASEGLVGRVKDAERDLHSVVFENTDGSLTLYYYNDPVKYVDEDGLVRDKSNKLQARTDGGFETVASDI